MIAATELRLILVTPETTLLDQNVSSLRFPLFDGLTGVLPGRAPLVGRLGTGELKYESSTGTGSVFIEGGFVQIKGTAVTILTSRAIQSAEINADDADRDLAEALALKPTTDAEFAQKQHSVDRARSMKSLKKRM